jgi:uncharacterized protein YjiS (DUF1127 family)
MTMSTIFSTPQSKAGQFRGQWLLAVLKRWWVAYTTWRDEEKAIAQLMSMNDWELKDIGLVRSDIARIVRGQAARDLTFGRN